MSERPETHFHPCPSVSIRALLNSIAKVGLKSFWAMNGWLAGVARVVGLGERLGLIHNHKDVQHGLRSRDASVDLPRGAMIRAPREEKAGSGEQTDDYGKRGKQSLMRIFHAGYQQH